MNFQQIVIGCDGIRSPIAKWMGFPEPKYAGHCGLRGLAFFPGGHKFEPKLNQIYGRGQRAGIVPISPTKVYWFVCFNRPSPGKLLTLNSEVSIFEFLYVFLQRAIFYYRSKNK